MGTPNSFGLFDLAGNAAEWVEDCYRDSYSGAPVDGRPRQISPCSDRVVRGGSWASDLHQLRTAFRDSAPPASAFNTIGFRLARTILP
jgi:formylglycine-generating enzyme required for sulfatase activity